MSYPSHINMTSMLTHMPITTNCTATLQNNLWHTTLACYCVYIGDQTMDDIKPTQIKCWQNPVYLAHNRMVSFKGSVMQQICENWWRRHYILQWSHLPWSRLPPRADILGLYSLLVGKMFLPLASTMCGTKDANWWRSIDTGWYMYLLQVTSIIVTVFLATQVPYTFVLYIQFYTSAARLIAHRWKYNSMTPTIRHNLHCLPNPQRTEFKLCTRVYKCLHGMAPA